MLVFLCQKSEAEKIKDSILTHYMKHHLVSPAAKSSCITKVIHSFIHIRLLNMLTDHNIIIWKYSSNRHLKTAHGPSTVSAQCRSETDLQPSQVRPVTPLLKELHWLRVPERIKFRLAVLVFKCRNKMAPQYLADDLQWAAYDGSRTRLRSASYNKLVMRRSRLSTAGDRTFGVAALRLWNSLPACVTSAKTLSTFRKHLKTQLFNQLYNL